LMCMTVTGWLVSVIQRWQLVRWPRWLGITIICFLNVLDWWYWSSGEGSFLNARAVFFGNMLSRLTMFR
jgi:hypothetical protein